MSTANKNKHDSMDKRISLTKEIFDSNREKIDQTTITFTRGESLKKAMEERSVTNGIIDSVVDDLRIVYGKNCNAGVRLGDNAQIMEIKDNLVKIKASLSFDFNVDGPYRFVPEGCDRETNWKCGVLALRLLEKKLEKMGLKTEVEKTAMKNRILRNRYYEHGDLDDETNEANLMACILREVTIGYNALELHLQGKTGDSFFSK